MTTDGDKISFRVGGNVPNGSQGRSHNPANTLKTTELYRWGTFESVNFNSVKLFFLSTRHCTFYLHF